MTTSFVLIGNYNDMISRITTNSDIFGDVLLIICDEIRTLVSPLTGVPIRPEII